MKYKILIILALFTLSLNAQMNVDTAGTGSQVPVVSITVENNLTSTNATNALAAQQGSILKGLIDAHEASTSNIDNTSDVNKPISTLTQSALDLKLDIANALVLGTTSTTALAGDSDLTADNLSNNTSDDLPEGSTNLYYPSADATKLSNIEALAKDDQTGLEILGLLNALPDVNQYTDTEKAKVAIAYTTADTADNVLTNLATQYDVSQAGGSSIFTTGGTAAGALNMDGNSITNVDTYQQLLGQFVVGTSDYTQLATIGTGQLFLGSSGTGDVTLRLKGSYGLDGQMPTSDGSGNLEWGGNIDMEGNNIADIDLLDLRVAPNGSNSWQIDIAADSSLQFGSSLGGVNLFKLKREGATESGDLIDYDHLLASLLTATSQTIAATGNFTPTAAIANITIAGNHDIDLVSMVDNQNIVISNNSVGIVNVGTVSANIQYAGGFINAGSRHALASGESIRVNMPTAGGNGIGIK